MLIIREVQLQTLSQSGRERFVDSMVDLLCRNFPALAASLTENDMRHRVDRSIARAAAHQFTSPQQVSLFVELAATYGWEFDSAPELPWVRAILADPALSKPDDRLERLVETYRHRQNVEKRNSVLREQLDQGLSTDSYQEPARNAQRGAAGPPKVNPEAAIGSSILPCAGTPLEPKKVIEVVVTGEDGRGLGDVQVRLSRSRTQVLDGRTGPTGAHRFRGLDPGTYHLSLPSLDQDAWLVQATEALPDGQANCTGTASWAVVPAPAIDAERTHIVVQGECVGEIGERYGFFPNTIWTYPVNAALKQKRHDNMHVLLEGDALVIPARRAKEQAVAAGNRVTVVRQGVPEHLRVRFLDHDGRPRAGVPYLLSVMTDSGAPVPDVMKKTDALGFVHHPIPPDAMRAIIVLQPGPSAEIHRLNIGHTNPIDEVSGWRARLNNLGYDCGLGMDTDLDEQTIAAITAFQYRFSLEQTGKMDGPTLDQLFDYYGS